MSFFEEQDDPARFKPLHEKRRRDILLNRALVVLLLGGFFGVGLVIGFVLGVTVALG